MLPLLDLSSNLPPLLPVFEKVPDFLPIALPTLPSQSLLLLRLPAGLDSPWEAEVVALIITSCVVYKYSRLAQFPKESKSAKIIFEMLDQNSRYFKRKSNSELGEVKYQTGVDGTINTAGKCTVARANQMAKGKLNLGEDKPTISKGQIKNQS